MAGILERRLRRGFTIVDLQHDGVCNSIGAENTSAAIAEGAAVLRLTLKPSDENQRLDEEYLHSHRLLTLQLSDNYIIERFHEFWERHSAEITDGLRLEIKSKGKVLSYRVKRATLRDSRLSLSLSDQPYTSAPSRQSHDVKRFH
jgi:hypothetical protein